MAVLIILIVFYDVLIMYRSLGAKSDIDEPADKSKSNDIEQSYCTGN